MTDILNKKTESCTGYRTPETDAEHDRIMESWSSKACDYDNMLAFARKLERERDAYENALVKIDKLVSDDCPDFALDSIQSLTNKILND